MRDQQKVTSFEPAEALNISHRKENRLDKAYIAIAKDGSEIASLRIYYPSSTAYACLWIFGGNYGSAYASGSGRAGGYGYCKASSAAGQAIRAAGIQLKRSVDGVGHEAVREAMSAIGRKIAGRKFLAIVEAHG